MAELEGWLQLIEQMFVRQEGWWVRRIRPAFRPSALV